MRIRQSTDDLLRKAHSHTESQILPDDEILKLFSSDFISKQPTLFNYLSQNNEIENMSMVYAREYNFAKSQQTSEQDKQNTLEQTFWVYKIMLLPNELLLRQQSFYNSQRTLKLIFRKLSILIHPDKNTHDMAANAFQKFFENYESLKESLL